MTAATIGVACVTRFVNRPLGKAAFASTGLTFAAGFLVVAALLLHLMVGLRGRMLARAREGERRPVVFACVGTALLMAAVGCLVAG
jgi:hypothetical protein